MNQLRDALTELRDTSPAMRAARAVLLLGVAGFLFALASAGPLAAWIVVVVVLLAAVSVLFPDSEVVIVLVVFGLWVWWAVVPDPQTWWALLGAGGLLFVHVGASVSATYPPTADLPRATARRWGRRTGVVAGVTAVVCLLGQWFARLAGPTNVALTALAFALVVGAVLLARHVSLDSGADSGADAAEPSDDD